MGGFELGIRIEQDGEDFFQLGKRVFLRETHVVLALVGKNIHKVLSADFGGAEMGLLHQQDVVDSKKGPVYLAGDLQGFLVGSQQAVQQLQSFLELSIAEGFGKGDLGSHPG